MRRDLLPILACPRCKEGLQLDVQEEDPTSGEVMSGTLTCGTCGHAYGIAGGIPDLRPPESG